ncbi:MAG: glycosyltransferase family 2 protein [Candidatus Omnitrophica bacterium]|nr:glycosyltransferase family 2 protein [Candidatus Omnitrophota bacterium]
MKNVSIICPVYNEALSIEELTIRIFDSVTRYVQSHEVELILVDDGSKDASVRIIQSLAKKYPFVRLVTHEQQRGQSYAISSGLSVAQGSVIVTMDADLQIYPEDIPLLLTKINEGYDIVNAIRMKRCAPLIHKIFSRLLAIVVSCICGNSVKDPASNFIAIRKEFVSNLRLIANDHRYLLAILRKRGMRRFAEVPVRHSKRKYGTSKYPLLKGIKAIVEFIPFYHRLQSGYYNVT